MDAAWNGILFGLLLTIFIGPVFFALIQTSVQDGFYSGFAMAVGIAFSDATYIAITYLGVSQILNDGEVQSWLGIVGGIIMLAFGIVSMTKRISTATKDGVVKKKRGILQQMLKGFLLNGINPSVFVFWLGIASLATVKYQYTGHGAITFFSFIIGTVLLTDIAKAFVATRLRKLLSVRFMKGMNIVVGIVLIVFGLQLLYFAVGG